MGHEFCGRERLGHVVVGARIEPADFIGHRIARGEHEHRGGDSRAAQVGDDIEPVFLGQHHVENCDVVFPLRRIGIASFAVIRRVNRVAGLF